AHGAAAEEDVIHKHHRLAGDVEGNFGRIHVGGDPLVEVVAMHADIESADRDRMVPDVGENRSQTPGEDDAAGLYTDQDRLRAAFVAFGDFVADAHQGALDRRGIED